MKRVVALAAVLWPFLFGCSSNAIYQPANGPETLENEKDILDVYPGDVRKNVEGYTNAGVGWAGIIRSTTAEEGTDGLIHATTTFEHHYFSWQQDSHLGSLQLHLSRRGEGLFRAEWALRRTDPDVDPVEAAEEYAKPGQLAIVYGVPQSVDDGTVVLKYRYLRIVSPEHYDTNEFDYGRFGEPSHYINHSLGMAR